MATPLVGESVSGQPSALTSGLELSRIELADFGARQMGVLRNGDAFPPSSLDFSPVGDAAVQPSKHNKKTAKVLVGAGVCGVAGIVGLSIESAEIAYAADPPPQPPNSRHCNAGEIPDPALIQVWIDNNGIQQVRQWCDANSAPPPTTPHTSPPPTNPPGGGGGGGTPPPTTVHHRPPTTTQPPVDADHDGFPVGPFEADDNSPGIGVDGLTLLQADMAARGLSWDGLDQPTKDIYTIVAISTDPKTFKDRLPAIYGVSTTTIAEATTTTEPTTTQETITTAAATTTSGTTAQSTTTTTLASATTGAKASSSTAQGGVIPVATTGPLKGGKKQESNTLPIIITALAVAMGGGVIIVTRRHNRDEEPRGKHVYTIPTGRRATPRGISHRSHHRP